MAAWRSAGTCPNMCQKVRTTTLKASHLDPTTGKEFDTLFELTYIAGRYLPKSTRWFTG